MTEQEGLELIKLFSKIQKDNKVLEVKINQIEMYLIEVVNSQKSYVQENTIVNDDVVSYYAMNELEKLEKIQSDIKDIIDKTM